MPSTITPKTSNINPSPHVIVAPIISASASASTSQQQLDFRTQTQINTIEYGMKRREATLKKKPRRFYDNNVIRCVDERDTLVDNEITKHLEVKKWKSLDMSFKWRFCKEYINSLDLKKEIKEHTTHLVQEALVAGQLTSVSYSVEDNKIVKLNMTITDGIII
jgi:hypothetical protein